VATEWGAGRAATGGTVLPEKKSGPPARLRPVSSTSTRGTRRVALATRPRGAIAAAAAADADRGGGNKGQSPKHLDSLLSSHSLEGDG